MRISVPTALSIAGLGILVLTLAGSAALAPGTGTGGGEHNLTLVGSQGGGPGLHDHGSVYLLNGTDRAWRVADANSYFEVEQAPDGSVVAGFMERGSRECGSYDAPCARTGYRVIDSEGDPEVVEEQAFPVRSATNSETHAAIPLPDGGVAVTDMERERLFVRENGTVTWEWSASSFYDAPPDPTRVDWLHLNDVDYIGDDRFLVSIRNANQLLVVERGAGVVEVVNADRSEEDDDHCTREGELDDYDGDGDVRCGDPSVMSHQHNPQWLGDGAVLVADSENDRVVELHRGEDGRWEPVWALREAGNVQFDWPRDADRLPNGHTLVTDSLNSRVVEVDSSGDLVWSASTERIPYEADRLPVGEPVGAPSVTGDEDVQDPGERSTLATLTHLAHTAVPALPYWFGELQLLGAVAGLALLGASVVFHVRHWLG